MKIRFLIILAFMLLVFPLMQSQIFACECFGSNDYTEIFDSSELVFVGSVNDIVANGENPKVSVVFDVHSIAKGELVHSQVTTNTWLSDCSVDYEIGTTYVVAINDKESLSTDRCSTKPLEIMNHYKVIPKQLLSAMVEPEVPYNNLEKSTEEQPPLENDEYPYASRGLSKMLKAVREDIPIGNYRFNDVVHGGGFSHGNLHISVNPEITDPAEQEEIFQELVVLLGYDGFEINFAEPATTAMMQQQDKALCENSEIMLVDGVCQKLDNDHEEPDCGPNTVLTDGVCVVIDGGCEPDINGDTTWCGPQYDYLQIILSEPSAFMFVFGIPFLIGGIIIGVILWRKRK